MSVRDMNILAASTRCISIGFATGFLVHSGPNLGPDIWPLIGLLAFTAALVLFFEFSDLETGGRGLSQRTRADARTAGRWQTVGKPERDWPE